MQFRKPSNLFVWIGLLSVIVTSGSLFEGLVRCVSTSGHNVIELAHRASSCDDGSESVRAALRSSALLTSDCEDTPLAPSLDAVVNPQREIVEVAPLQPVAWLSHTYLADARPARASARSPSALAADMAAPLLRSVILLI